MDFICYLFNVAGTVFQRLNQLYPVFIISKRKFAFSIVNIILFMLCYTLCLA